MKSFAILSVLTATVLAQSGTSSSSSDPLIPSGISDSCQKFLLSLNNDASLAACTAPVISATSAYGSTGNSASTPSAASISSSLDTLCSSTVLSACSKSMLSSKLASFAQACSVELVSSPVAAVRSLYDALYIMNPFCNAMCSKDDSGRYCATESTANSTGSTGATGELQQQYLWTPVSSTSLSRRDSSAVVLNVTTFASFDIAFLCLKPGLNDSTLCTPCTRNIVTSYINFESDVPYACGLAQSPLLGGQPDLYSAVQTKCGGNFLSGAVQAAGGISGGVLGSGAPRSVGDFKGTMAMMFGVVGLGFTAFL